MNNHLDQSPQMQYHHSNAHTSEVLNSHHNHNHDDVIDSDSSSDYDNPYQETAWDWHCRHARRIARRRCGVDSTDDDDDDSAESLEEGDDERDTERAFREVDGVFWKWMESFPLVAARCCLSYIENDITAATTRNGGCFHNFHSERRQTAREREARELRRVFRKISKRRKGVPWMYPEDTEPAVSALSADEQMIKYHQLVIDSILPRGLGISFIDAVLSKQSNALAKQSVHKISTSEKKQKCTFCRIVLEINGPARSGMTSILIALAARYVANTSRLFLQADGRDHSATTSPRTFTSPNNFIDCEIDPSHNATLQPNNRCDTVHSTTVTKEPNAVILDLEHGVHTVKLVLSVREAVICRWEETSLARKCNRQQRHALRLKSRQESAESLANGHDDLEEIVDMAVEQRQIERAIASCLGRIHIIQPRDFTYLSLVATVESINNKLDSEKFQRQQTKLQAHVQDPPMLLIIDSLSTLDACTRAQESLPTVSGTKSEGSGLSERNEFYRQLVRLREEHEVTIVGAARNVPNVHKHASDSGQRRTGSIWDKMVTQRVALHHVAEGTVEEKEGFSFVATIKSDQGDSSVFPYSVTASGIYS
ncbi:hypothetical protein ACHAW6_015030 [Cyclotella cf. meneghiniana]